MEESQVCPQPPITPICHLNHVPFAAIRHDEAIEMMASLIENRDPSFIITANLNYLMLADRHPELDAVNRQAAIIVADGMPLVWMSRWKENPLPERIAGSDLIFDLSRLAAERGYSLFLLGGDPGVADRAAVELERKYPGLRVVGTACPPFRELERHELDELAKQIRDANPDLLITALSQPKGEMFIAQNFRDWRVPLCAQLGMSMDLVVGRVSRAPLWMQRNGLEMAYRLAQEPRRLFGRYSKNFFFLIRLIATDCGAAVSNLARRGSARKTLHDRDSN
jgi:N-acetylglucosaminyldiphosphoundecaprenol N-acetyl-beta-D-mannosaminyltransferase